MRDAITSLNAWISEKLPDVAHSFAPGSPVSFPCVVVVPRTLGGKTKPAGGPAALATVTFQADCWADGGDALAARTIAQRILAALLGDTDRGARIPRHRWIYGEGEPVRAEMRDEMVVTDARIAEIPIRDAPELRLCRAIFDLRFVLTA
ncbi:MAG: hypothetical protein HRF49_01420 [bacterium]|jgi:hypothetical protein